MNTNPFRRLRLESESTLEQLARKTNISKQALIRLEQGTYPDPLPTALSYFSSNFHLSETDLRNQYEEYQHETRAHHNRYFGDVRSILSEGTLNPSSPETLSVSHPFRLLRGDRSPTVVAKDLCIPHATITYFERNVVQQKSVPKVLISVMREIGHFKSETDALITAYEFYRQAVLTYRDSNGLRTDYGYQPKRPVTR